MLTIVSIRFIHRKTEIGSKEVKKEKKNYTISEDKKSCTPPPRFNIPSNYISTHR